MAYGIDYDRDPKEKIKAFEAAKSSEESVIEMKKITKHTKMTKKRLKVGLKGSMKNLINQK